VSKTATLEIHHIYVPLKAATEGALLFDSLMAPIELTIVGNNFSLRIGRPTSSVITKLSLIDVATPFDVEADALELLGATSTPYASVVRCQALTAPVAITAALQVNAENLTLIVGGLAAGVHFLTGGWAVADTVFRTQWLRLILSAPSLAIVEENESLPIDCDLARPTLWLNIASHFSAPVEGQPPRERRCGRRLLHRPGPRQLRRR
jgi:hypothetical protein